MTGPRSRGEVIGDFTGQSQKSRLKNNRLLNIDCYNYDNNEYLLHHILSLFFLFFNRSDSTQYSFPLGPLILLPVYQRVRPVQYEPLQLSYPGEPISVPAAVWIPRAGLSAVWLEPEYCELWASSWCCSCATAAAISKRCFTSSSWG